MADQAQAGQQGGGNLDSMLSQGIPGATQNQVDPQVASILANKNQSSGQPSPGAGKTGEGTTSPDARKAGGQNSQQQPQDGQTPSKGKEPDAKGPSIDDMKARLSLREPEGETLEKVKRDLAASSKEAQRLKDELEAIRTLGADDGYDYQRDGEGKMQRVSKGKKAEASSDGLATLETLSAKDAKSFAQLLVDDPDPEKVFAFVAERTTRTVKIPAPTVDKIIRPLSEERVDAAIAHVAEKFGEDMYPNLKEMGAMVKWQIENAPAAIKRAFYEAPEAMIRLFAGDIEAASQSFHRAAQAKENAKRTKEDAARKAADFTPPEGGGVPAFAGDGSGTVERQIAKEIAAARP